MHIFIFMFLFHTTGDISIIVLPQSIHCIILPTNKTIFWLIFIHDNLSLLFYLLINHAYYQSQKYSYFVGPRPLIQPVENKLFSPDFND